MKKAVPNARKQGRKKKAARKPAHPKGLSYRERRPEDEDFLVDITLAAMKKVYEQSVGATLTKEAVLSLLNDSRTTRIILMDGLPVGYYTYSIHTPGRMYWGSLILNQEARGQGLGHKVVDHIDEEARSHGVRVIDGHCQVGNRRALAFWMRHGFRVVGYPVAGSFPIQKIV